MENKKSENDSVQNDGALTLGDFLKACMAKWQWFVISVGFFVCLAAAYVVRKQPEYKRTMSVLVKDNEGGGLADIAGAFSLMGLGGGNSNVNNELIALTSPAVMLEVVEDLKLNTNYVQKGFPRGTTLYGTTQPFILEFLDVPEHEGASVKIDVSPDGSMRLYKFMRVDADGKTKYDGEVSTKERFTTVKTPLGRVRISPNPRYTGNWFDEDATLFVSRGSLMGTVESYNRRLQGDLTDMDADIIDLSITDVSVERANDILNTVLEVYTGNWVADKNKISEATSEFIDERLDKLKVELGSADNKVMTYNKRHLIPDLEESGKLSLQTTQKLETDIIDGAYRLALAKYVAEYVENPANRNKVIPANTGGVSMELESQISQYNALLLARDNLAQTTSEQNPLVKDYDTRLKGMHEAIARALQTQVVAFSTLVSSLQGNKEKYTGKISEMPQIAMDLRSMERDRNVKEQLYIFLLQKREENQLNQKFTADNTRIITPPMGPSAPVAPKKLMILAIAFLFGLALPATIIYIRESSNTKIRSRRDLGRMITPFVGEIPYIGKKQNIFARMVRRGKKGKKELETVDVQVRSGSRDIVNESFRIVRGNLEFMNRSQKGNVLMVTSLNPGSGKSFVTFNLAAAFALKGKRVLVIDCDLRHGSTSQYVGMPSKGLSAYLTGSVSDWQRLVVPVQDHPDFFVLPIGHRPPNPAELLDTSEMQNLVKEATQEYDIVVLDCPPVDIVVDTQILSPLVNRTVFVVRAGLLEKASVKEVDEMYTEARFPNMTILLNGTYKKDSRYGSGSGYYGSAYEVNE